MKTEIFGRIVLTLAFVAMIVAVARAAFADPPSPRGAPAGQAVSPAAAIERVLEQRIGGGVSVRVTAIDTVVAAEPGLAALPEPGGRAGRPTRFVLTTGRARRGVAVATVTVSGSYARAARAIARDEIIAADAIEVVDGELPPIAFKRLPAAGEAVGLTARRDIAAGEALTEAVLQFPPLVRSGDAVTVTVRIGAVEVTSTGTASGSGFEGDLLRVTPRGGRPVTARITGPGRVEIVQ